ncbi:olfactory receptor 2D2-like [Ranitomeya imitator]|uniref:olfactory receptor 2D2-like n=1 Tax=Ranitomeya imitator TaxID=111125 RepID=UPI0037E7CA34
MSTKGTVDPSASEAHQVPNTIDAAEHLLQNKMFISDQARKKNDPSFDFTELTPPESSSSTRYDNIAKRRDSRNTVSVRKTDVPLTIPVFTKTNNVAPKVMNSNHNDTNKEMVEYRMKVYVFGNSPPAVATYGLRRTAFAGAAEFGKDAQQFVEKDFYVDDSLKSLPTAEEATDLLKRTQGPEFLHDQCKETAIEDSFNLQDPDVDPEIRPDVSTFITKFKEKWSVRRLSEKRGKVSSKQTRFIHKEEKTKYQEQRITEINLTVNSEFFLLGFQNGQRSTIFLFCLLLVVYCGTMCGNLLIITLVSSSKNLHTPMYFFISQLSVSDIILTTDIVPNMFHILLNNGASITVNACITQFYFFCVAEAFECFLLTVMSYDRYVAICNPLRYTSTMTSDRCVILAIICWMLSFSITLMYCITISMMMFCGPNIIDHFFCDLVPLIERACSSTYAFELEVFIMCFPILFLPLIVIIISYINIVVTIARFQSNLSRQKAFSTCSSHLIVVSIFYSTLLSVYMFPKGEETLNFSKLLSLLYTVFTPLINPIIYSLRNKDIKKSLRELINKSGMFSNDIIFPR